MLFLYFAEESHVKQDMYHGFERAQGVVKPSAEARMQEAFKDKDDQWSPDQEDAQTNASLHAFGERFSLCTVFAVSQQCCRRLDCGRQSHCILPHMR